MVQPRYRVDGFLERLGHGDQHLVDGEDAVIDADHDARKIGIRENRDGNSQSQVDSHRDQRQDDEDDRLAVARGPMFDFPGARRSAEVSKAGSFSFRLAPGLFSALVDWVSWEPILPVRWCLRRRIPRPQW